MQRDEILTLLKSYIPPGFMYGGSFLLPPDAALTLVDSLERLGVTILGVNCWFVGGPENKWIGEDIDVELSVSMEVLQSEERAQKSAEAVREFLRTGLLEYHRFVSLTLAMPFEDKKFLLDNLKQVNEPK